MDQSPFSKLSPELRNAIYELVLILRQPIAIIGSQELHQKKHARRTLESTRQKNTPRLWRPNMKPLYEDIFTAMAVLKTCKAVRCEGVSLFYGSNTFAFVWRCDNWNPDQYLLVDNFHKMVSGTAHDIQLKNIFVQLHDSAGSEVLSAVHSGGGLRRVIAQLRRQAAATESLPFRVRALMRILRRHEQVLLDTHDLETSVQDVITKFTVMRDMEVLPPEKDMLEVLVRDLSWSQQEAESELVEFKRKLNGRA